ncbi:MAG: class I SAM-dependent methyltransferase, partial [Streptomycetaceae bacterium]|nr:class I SAM-dependent methyltransferase [Streptomycetaceae bacterium]
RSVDTAAGPVLDIGAGTGISTQVVADTLPDARIVAVEPSPAMRAGLDARIRENPTLRERVVVCPTPLEEATLPVRVSAVVATAVLHHFDADGRRRLLGLLAEHLAPGAPAFVEVQEPPEPCSVPRTRYHTAAAGEFVHEGWMRAEPESSTTMRWTMTYRTLRGTELLDERHTAFTMHPVPPGQLAAEAGDVGLAARQLAHGLMELRRPT